MEKARAHVFVSGRVQGVFFRQKTKDQAEIRGVTGWVKNLEDGRVEAVFEGDEDAVKSLVEFCKNGPRGANVLNANVNWQSFKGEFKSFEIAY